MTASVHLLNVAPGDCTIIRHAKGNVSMIDVCDGNLTHLQKAMKVEAATVRPRGNFGMCGRPTNPITYATDLGISSIFRFILTHPDMDHLDGFNSLADEFSIYNFWDTGARRDRPSFAAGPYLEEDWDRYEKVLSGKDGTSVAIRRAGARFAHANKGEDGGSGGDGLYILAPDIELLNDADMNDDINDGSYVILYRSAGGRVLLPGDAHDNSWNYVMQNYPSDVANCSFLLAPHHGRDSNRSYDFLDIVRPHLTLIGCSPSEHIDYGQWSRRELEYVTSNQTGNVVLEPVDGKLLVFIENASYASAKGCDTTVMNSQGYVHLYTITPTPE